MGGDRERLTLVTAHLMQWLVVPYERLGEAEAYLTGSYLVSASLSLLSGILLIWALIGLYAPQSRAMGTFGLWAFIVAFLGAALNAGNSWAELFVWPTLALVAPNVMSGKATDAPAYLARAASTCRSRCWVSASSCSGLQRSLQVCIRAGRQLC
jgi:hypothetical protein